MTHAELVQRATQWLRGTRKCSVVFSEIVTVMPETPDVIGWSRSWTSELVEVKTSRADFRRDQKKFRSRNGMGRMRWYFTPPGLVTVDELPDGWGLAEAHPRIVRVIREPVPRTDYNQQGELGVLLSAVRRHQLGVAFNAKTCRFAPCVTVKR